MDFVNPNPSAFLISFFIQVKGQHHDFLVEDKARADERKEIIDVVQDMIEHHNQLFEVFIYRKSSKNTDLDI